MNFSVAALIKATQFPVTSQVYIRQRFADSQQLLLALTWCFTALLGIHHRKLFTGLEHRT